MSRTPRPRKLTIDGRVWRWYVKGQRGALVILSPGGERTTVPAVTFLRWAGHKSPGCAVENIYYEIRPSFVRSYIETVILSGLTMNMPS